TQLHGVAGLPDQRISGRGGRQLQPTQLLDAGGADPVRVGRENAHKNGPSRFWRCLSGHANSTAVPPARANEPLPASAVRSEGWPTNRNILGAFRIRSGIPDSLTSPRHHGLSGVDIDHAAGVFNPDGAP